MRIRGFFLLRRYTLSAFIIILLLFAIILMSLRVKQRKGLDFFDALMMYGLEATPVSAGQKFEL